MSDSSENLETSRKNMDLELSRIDDLQSQWDWLLDHLQIYLQRLEALCEQLSRPPREFMSTSVFCNLRVAVEHVERILLERNVENSEWNRFRDSFKDLPNAENVTQCLLFCQSVCDLNLRM